MPSLSVPALILAVLASQDALWREDLVAVQGGDFKIFERMDRDGTDAVGPQPVHASVQRCASPWVGVAAGATRFEILESHVGCT